LAPRSRKTGQRHKPDRTTAAAAAEKAAMSRSQRRDAEARAQLEPLAPGERPWPVTVASGVAAVLAATNFILYTVGYRPRHIHPKLAEILVFTALMAMCSYGTWRLRYWAILGFEALLAIGLLGFSLAIIKANSIFVALGCTAVIGAAGYLFWKLVRVMSRIQMPQPPQRRPEP
jgi:hypothetical protein